jgi:predicted SnoaL-like aldol condensation-catalyzing enzyme
MRKMNNKSSRRSVMRSLAGVAMCAALAMGYSSAASAVEYTAKEKANVEAVRGLYDALDGAKGKLSKAIAGIANKYIAPDYIQHSSGGMNGRDAFIAQFQGKGTGGGEGAGANSPVVTLMADGDYVARITGSGAKLIWNMFRVDNGMLVEHWDAGIGGQTGGAPGGPPGGPPAGAPPGGAPPAQ